MSSPRFGSVVPRPRARPPRRSGRGCRAGCDRSGCTARACRPRWPLASGLRLRPAPSPRRARCRALRASPRRAPSRRDRRRRGRRPWGCVTLCPSRFRRARAPAASGSVVLYPRAASSVGRGVEDGSGRRCDSRRAHSAPGRRIQPFPSIPTLTVGPGIPPGPPTTGCGRVADCHRRWGVAPRPGNGWLSAGQYTERGSDPASGRIAGPTRCVGRWRSCCRRRAWRTASSRWPRPPLRRSGRTRGWSCWRCRR